MENLPNLPVSSHKAQAYQILHLALSSRPLPRVPKLQPWGQIWPHPGGHMFHMGLYRENFRNLSVPSLPNFACSPIQRASNPVCPNYSTGVKFGPTLGGGGHNFDIGLYWENFRNLPVPSHKAQGYQIMHVALSIGPSQRSVNCSPRVKLIAKGHKFYMELYSEIFQNLLFTIYIRTMANNFSPSQGGLMF